MELLAFGDTGYGDELFFGALTTIQLAVFGYVLALALGLVFAVLALKGKGPRWWLFRVYASIFTGVPSLLIIFLFYFGGAELVRSLLAPIGINVRLDVSPFTAGVAALGLVYAAYLGDLIRSAIINVPRGQFEACEALSVPRRHMWLSVVLPQAFRIALPGLVNTWIVLLKDTALVSLAGLNDLIANAKVAAGSTKEPFVFFTAALLFFVVIATVTLPLVNRVARRLERGQRRAEV
ncbi:ABC transporter permease subunit [Zavarzinia compransoris]|uniref:ABC transporter permease n=1 Tax=Zavarzinia marina TaxID=2911065 RepID=UPI001EE9D5B2|nr:ABC transporter permease subunit [Zavarzinia marina]MCF4166303.1 ABC transporter permease subunit [Zavarzinia marina]